jgi:indolepyruvate ferredoxin oxidoreductase beta subunit
MKLRLLFTGVGGQGILTGANILSQAFLAKDEHVLMSEVHGMAQRGGSVVCTVCAGAVKSPLIANGTADAVVAMEPLEALRSLKKLRPSGIILTDVNPVIPPNVSMGYSDYPLLEDVFRELEKHGDLIKIDALTLAKKAGHAITKNIVMLGALAGTAIIPIGKRDLLATIRSRISSQYVDMNERAFMAGFEMVSKRR